MCVCVCASLCSYHQCRSVYVLSVLRRSVFFCFLRPCFWFYFDSDTDRKHSSDGVKALNYHIPPSTFFCVKINLKFRDHFHHLLLNTEIYTIYPVFFLFLFFYCCPGQSFIFALPFFPFFPHSSLCFLIWIEGLYFVRTAKPFWKRFEIWSSINKTDYTRLACEPPNKNQHLACKKRRHRLQVCQNQSDLYSHFY